MNMNQFIRIAKKNINRCQHHQYWVSAVIIKKNKIVSVGFNSLKTHPKMNSEKTLHAEVSAVLRAKRQDIAGATVFVLRSTRSGKVGMAKPCEICDRILRISGIKNVYYTTSNGEIAQLVF